jgi:hypothetical protein
MNEAVELHDSAITAIHHAGSDMVLELVAIVHSSEGRPGRDPGKTGTQPAELVIEDAHIASTPTSLPLSILSGRISTDAETLENVLPLPIDMAGDVRLELSGAEGTLSAKGRRVRLALRGTWKYLGDFR